MTTSTTHIDGHEPARSVEEQATAIEELVRLSLAKAKEDGVAMDGRMLRQSHAKQHGLVYAVFTVRQNLPDRLSVGLFAEPKAYHAYVRYSNSEGPNVPDNEPQLRGMSIKVFGVPGDKLLEYEKQAVTHDFILVNHPVFPVRDAVDFLEFTRCLHEGKPQKFFMGGINPAKWRLREMQIARAYRARAVDNPLAIPYWSATPYRYGKTSVKYGVTPALLVNVDKPDYDEHNYLRQAMLYTLYDQEVFLDFRVALRGESERMPIDDARVEWWPAETYTVAQIRIPRQRFDTPKRRLIGDNLAFNPWHCLPEHEPLGSLNKARGKVYEALSVLRRETNGVVSEEPTAPEDMD